MKEYICPKGCDWYIKLTPYGDQSGLLKKCPYCGGQLKEKEKK